MVSTNSPISQVTANFVIGSISSACLFLLWSIILGVRNSCHRQDREEADRQCPSSIPVLGNP